MLSDKEYKDAPGVLDGGDNVTPSSSPAAAPQESAPKPGAEEYSPKQDDNGSIEYCGGSRGLICKTGMCCSSHG